MSKAKAKETIDNQTTDDATVVLREESNAVAELT